MVDSTSTTGPKGSVAEKAACRERMVARLKAVPSSERARASEAASRTLVRLLDRLLAPGAPVALFAPTPTELSCEPAVHLLAGRHPIAYPRVDGERIRFQESPFHELSAHTSKVREPAIHAPVVEPAAIVIPGRAFDRRGIRLGRGAGFFDRTLAALPADTLLIGYIYAFQLVDELPAEPYDRWVHLVVTEEGEPLRCRPLPAPYARTHDVAAGSSDGGGTRPPWTAT